jgi:hypothetical protein
MIIGLSHLGTLSCSHQEGGQDQREIEGIWLSSPLVSLPSHTAHGCEYLVMSVSGNWTNP